MALTKEQIAKAVEALKNSASTVLLEASSENLQGDWKQYWVQKDMSSEPELILSSKALTIGSEVFVKATTRGTRIAV